MKKFFLIFVFLYTANLNADQALYGSFFGNDNWAAGTYKISSDRNEPVSAGLYLYTIQAGELRQTKKMVLLK